jgi:hypothetical protein
MYFKNSVMCITILSSVRNLVTQQGCTVKNPVQHTYQHQQRKIPNKMDAFCVVTLTSETIMYTV